MLTWASQLIVQLFHIPSGECCEQSHQTAGMSLLQTIHCMVTWAGYQLHDLPLHQEVWYEEFCLVQILINWHIHEIYNHLKPHCCVLEEEKIARKHYLSDCYILLREASCPTTKSSFSANFISVDSLLL